jgi:glycosyltransferase involved in cell wall biosynthesis
MKVDHLRDSHFVEARSNGSTHTEQWIQLCNGLDPERDGGMVPSILGFASALAQARGEVSLVSPTPSRRDLLAIDPGIRLAEPEADLERWVRRASVVHVHGLWQRHGRVGARLARKHRVPYVVAAHGMADPWALRQKAWKKRVYGLLIEDRNLRHAACLHALAVPEVASLRAIAPRTPIALVPNGVDLRPFDDLPPRAELEESHPELRDRFLLLFFGRLHAKKGLDLLAQALARVARAHPEVHLLLAGRDDGALVPFQSAMRQAELSGRLTVFGHLAGEDARRAWGAADAFILPSYSEGFSMSVLEALAARVPAVVTHACNFPELAQARAAIAVEATADAVTEGLTALLGMDRADRRAMAERGRSLVESRYGWSPQGQKLAAVYRWLTGGGPAPECIVAGLGTH